MNQIPQSGAIAVKAMLCDECWSVISPGDRYVFAEHPVDAVRVWKIHSVCPD